MEQGMNIARINMSSIQNKEHKVLIDMIKKAGKLTKDNESSNQAKCGILLDLQGPVIRTGEFKDHALSVQILDLSFQVELKAGQEFRIVCKKKILGDETFTVCDFGDLSGKLLN